MSGLAGNNHRRTGPATEVAVPTGSGAVRTDILNLPNVVTGARLCAVPFAVWLAWRGFLATTFIVFALAAVSDALDGWLARRRGGSALGAALDPLADKALLVSMFVTLAATGVLPVWLAVLTVTRDVLILGGIGLWRWRGLAVTIRPLAISKLNTALQLLLIAAVLLQRGFGLPGAAGVTALVWLVAASTVASAAAYIRVAAR